MKNKTIKSTTLEIIKFYLAKDAEIVNLEVKNKWLTTTLPNCRFSVKNK